MDNYNNENEFAHLNLHVTSWSKFNQALYNEYLNMKAELDEYNFFESHLDYELPYLIATSKNYENSKVKIMVVSQETEYWGNKELKHQNKYENRDVEDMDFCSYKDMILNLSLPNEIIKALMILYDDRINKHWGPTSGPLWTFYSTLREILEQNASNQFGLVHSNVAKIANVAGEKINGVRSESKINTQLVKYLKKEIEIIDPYIVIFTIGKTKHYIKLMEQISPSIINQMCNCLSTSTPIIGPEVHYLEGREIFLSLIIRTV